ncbi:protein Cep89 homolog isoform X1 [Pieris napi]|uniref:protein Cep89 homolog isoform X1 n=2 Tax=Pieris napi TaxID=78633 RepID=UPI001FBBDF4E|nr:protein Cep89 homolog isoform X1 [Pieris napi]
MAECERIVQPHSRRISKDSKNDKQRLTFSGNFAESGRHFDITADRDSMRQDILNAVMMRTQSHIGVNPLYEDPRDVIDKPLKPPRKRNFHAVAVSSPRTKDKSSKEHKRKLTKKYEGLVTALMDKCEENLIMISEKDTQISKLKEKLKAILDYNRLFADENDRLKGENEELIKYIEECKRVIKGERDRSGKCEKKCKELEERVKQYHMPDRDTEPQAIPLVEVCMSCSSRQIVLNQSKEHNTRLQKDLQAMKDVLYRLNVQLSRYQEKLRTTKTDGKDFKSEKYECFDSLLTVNFAQKQDGENDVIQTKAEDVGTSRFVDISGLLSAQALAPLFDAYQENLQEKENLIMDYEKQFESINKKSKEIVTENKSLLDRVVNLETELVGVRQNYKKLVVEKETGDIERASLLERADRAESKLKEVYELYEDKMAAMMRDYEMVHREYFTVKTALEASTGKMAQMDVMRTRTVPADLHERRLEDCKRLLEELKHQYSMDTERKNEQIKKMQEDLSYADERYEKVCQQLDTVQEELQAALKNVKLYRRAALVFRKRARSASARAVRAKRVRRDNEPLKQALAALEKIKSEIKVVKSRAYTSLEELERRIVSQERRATHAQAEYKRSLERASLALQHKEEIIRSLIDKVADVEEVRLSQANAHRLQGIVSSSDSSKSQEPKMKLVPGPGGYFKEDKKKREEIRCKREDRRKASDSGS